MTLDPSSNDEEEEEEGEEEEEEEEGEEEGEKEKDKQRVPRTAQEVLHAAGVDLHLDSVPSGEGAPLELVSQVHLAIYTTYSFVSMVTVSFVLQFLTCVMDEEYEAAKLLCEKSKSFSSSPYALYHTLSPYLSPTSPSPTPSLSPASFLLTSSFSPFLSHTPSSSLRI